MKTCNYELDRYFSSSTGEDKVTLCGYAPVALWGHCEAHLTPRERAVWEVIEAFVDIERNYGCETTMWQRIHRAVAAVKEQT